jgi:hypothetical protein
MHAGDCCIRDRCNKRLCIGAELFCYAWYSVFVEQMRVTQLTKKFLAVIKLEWCITITIKTSHWNFP